MPKPIFFFRQDAEFGFLCQWYPAAFTSADGSITFNCAEQWMMWHKAEMAGDEAAQAAILKTKNPRKQKSLGREVEGFDENKWDEIKSRVVEEGNYLKFTQNEQLKRWLLATGEKELAEASSFDRVWGIGYSAVDAARAPREKWGQNLLGQALVKVRERIQAELDHDNSPEGSTKAEPAEDTET